MEGQGKMRMQKILDPRHQTFEPLSAFGQEDEIVGIAYVMLRLECVLGELVEFVHINIH